MDIEKIVYEYPTKNQEGFIYTEIKQLLTEHNLDEEVFYEALGVNTCMVIDGQTVIYHCDIAKAFCCVVEDRDQTFEEWD